jgi:glycosyltransferase involved in cell wall biosynthesis
MDISQKPRLGDLKWVREIRAAAPKGSIIHGQATTGGFYARLAASRSCPAVFTPHSFVTMMPYVGDRAKVVYGQMERFLAKRTARIICVSKFEAEHGKTLGIDPKKLRVVYNGIAPLACADRSEVRAQWGVGPETLVVGFVGRFDPPKNPALAVRAFEKLRGLNARLVMVGSGSLQGEVDAVIGDFPVTLLGGVHAEPLLGGMDVHLMSSDAESLPYVLIEAQSLGQPIVTTDVGAAREIVTDGRDGFVCPPGDADSLGTALRKIAENQELRTSLAQEAVVAGSRFSLDRMVEGTLSVYSEALS